MKSKKGQQGMEIAKSFVLGLMVLLIIGVTTLIVLNSLEDSSLISADTLSESVTNETGAWINSTGYTLDKASSTGFSTPVITAAYNVTNASDHVLIGSGNYTVSGAGVVTNATATTWDNVSISYTYNYETQSSEQSVISNGTDSISDFFSNTSIWLSLLAIVVLILIIAVVIGVVNGFGGRRSSVR